MAPDLSSQEVEVAERADLRQLLLGAMADLELGRASVGCLITGSAEIRRLNRRFAGVDRSTDVLAFPARDATEPGFVLPSDQETYLGDMVISVADARGRGDWASELRLLAVHGLLHLLGHDHHDPVGAATMTGETRRLLAAAAARRGEPAPAVEPLEPAESP